MIEIKTVEENVKTLLKLWPELRSSDKMLIAAYYRQFHNVTTFQQFAIDTSLPSTETIRRTRQKIQARGEFVATELTKQRRDELIEVYRTYAKEEGENNGTT